MLDKTIQVKTSIKISNVVKQASPFISLLKLQVIRNYLWWLIPQCVVLVEYKEPDINFKFLQVLLLIFTAFINGYFNTQIST